MHAPDPITPRANVHRPARFGEASGNCLLPNGPSGAEDHSPECEPGVPVEEREQTPAEWQRSVMPDQERARLRPISPQTQSFPWPARLCTKAGLECSRPREHPSQATASSQHGCSTGDGAPALGAVFAGPRTLVCSRQLLIHRLRLRENGQHSGPSSSERCRRLWVTPGFRHATPSSADATDTLHLVSNACLSPTWGAHLC